MVIKFNPGLYNNYTQQNIMHVLSMAAQTDFYLYNLILSPFDYVVVDGDIHKSQWTSDNVNDNYWFSLKGYTGNDYPIANFKSVHVYVCFRRFHHDKRSGQYTMGTCMNPTPYKGTDIASIERLQGYWEFVSMSYGTPTNYAQSKKQQNQVKIKTPVKKKLEIIDPKTGKPIMMAGGGSNDTTVDNLKINNDEITDFTREVVKLKSLSLLKVIKIFQKIIARRKRAASVPLLKGGSKKPKSKSSKSKNKK